MVFEQIIDGKAEQIVLGGLIENKTVTRQVGSGTHEIIVVRSSEALYGDSTYIPFTFGGGAKQLPPTEYARRIEYIGDSITCGYGDEGPNATCPYDIPIRQVKNETTGLARGREDPRDPEHLSRVRLARGAQALGAGRRRSASRARASYQNYREACKGEGACAPGKAPDDPDAKTTIPEYYLRTLATERPDSGGTAYDFSKETDQDKPQVVVINIGTNDFARDLNQDSVADGIDLGKFRDALQGLRPVRAHEAPRRRDLPRRAADGHRQVPARQRAHGLPQRRSARVADGPQRRRRHEGLLDGARRDGRSLRPRVRLPPEPRGASHHGRSGRRARSTRRRAGRRSTRNERSSQPQSHARRAVSAAAAATTIRWRTSRRRSRRSTARSARAPTRRSRIARSSRTTSSSRRSRSSAASSLASLFAYFVSSPKFSAPGTWANSFRVDTALIVFWGPLLYCRDGEAAALEEPAHLPRARALHRGVQRGDVQGHGRRRRGRGRLLEHRDVAGRGRVLRDAEGVLGHAGRLALGVLLRHRRAALPRRLGEEVRRLDAAAEVRAARAPRVPRAPSSASRCSASFAAAASSPRSARRSICIQLPLVALLFLYALRIPEDLASVGTAFVAVAVARSRPRHVHLLRRLRAGRHHEPARQARVVHEPLGLGALRDRADDPARARARAADVEGHPALAAPRGADPPRHRAEQPPARVRQPRGGAARHLPRPEAEQAEAARRPGRSRSPCR